MTSRPMTGRPMASRLAALMPPGRAHLLHSHLRLCVLTGVLQGVTFALVVPVLERLLAGDVAAAGPWLAALVVGAVGSGVLQHLATVRGFAAGAELLAGLRHRIGDHVGTLPIAWFTGERAGALAYTLSAGVMDLLALPVRQLAAVIRATVTPVVLVAATALFDVRLALVAAATVPLVAAAYWWSGRLGRRADAAVNAAAAESADRMVEFAQSQAVLRAFGRGTTGYAEFDRALLRQHRAERRQLWLALPPLVANGMVARLAFLALLATATAAALGGDSRVVTVVALLAVVNRIVEPLGDVAAQGVVIRMATAQLAAVEEILATEPLPQPASPAARPTRADVELREVSFAYTPGRPVLRGVSLRIPEGTMTALVGASGSGKSTLVKLIARFADPGEGAVLVGGVDVRHLRTEQLMGLIAPVFQNAYLFSGTVRDNIRLARPGASDAEVRAAGELARVSEVVDRLPQGWDTPVGEGGTRLSGGERQRVAIARALLKDAPIVLLDEATSALDAENQAAVTAGLLQIRRRSTMLVIAHQLATVAEADRIVVLDDGRVVEHGTHEELLAMNRRYAAFWQARTAAEGWRLAGG